MAYVARHTGRCRLAELGRVRAQCRRVRRTSRHNPASPNPATPLPRYPATPPPRLPQTLLTHSPFPPALFPYYLHILPSHAVRSRDSTPQPRFPITTDQHHPKRLIPTYLTPLHPTPTHLQSKAMLHIHRIAPPSPHRPMLPVVHSFAKPHVDSRKTMNQTAQQQDSSEPSNGRQE